ncbi:MAG: GNAT family N-acetyltransferase [Clostridiales bacterium]|jgi:GNAT superfamily N-acetyltransferase|nr:GNAT family N-acetyltransferase [Clostridiales bacterium]
MEYKFDEFYISDKKSLIQPNQVYKLLSKTYWAERRSREIVEKAIENSICFGLYKDEVMVGFARVITDHATVYRLEDVVIDENYRGLGLGKALIKFITEHEDFSSLIGVLETRDAHRLYEQFGFQTSKGFAMRKDPHRHAE